VKPDSPLPSPAKARMGLALLLLATLLLDQWTKWLARVHFGLPGGEPDYFKVKRVLGEWFQLRLVYNQGAAFGMRPQHLLPWLNPTLFYALFSAVAIGFLIFLYRRVPRGDYWQKTGITLILSGAFGNLVDRMRFDKVTDFLDVGVPGYAWRWPTFNVADSCVCIGVAMLVLATRQPRTKDAAAARPDGTTESPA
jgi:signal peptidase II